jgi:hypothetical protein
MPGSPDSVTDMNLGAAATVEMTAAPDHEWAVVTDVPRIGELSPETFETNA